MTFQLLFKPMTISLATRKSVKADSQLQCRTDSKRTLPKLKTAEDVEELRRMLAEIIFKTGGVVTVTLLVTGIIALATRQIVYTAAPLIIDYVTTEAVDSLRPE